MTQPHDTGYKLLFSHPELVRDLILGFVPDDWLHSLDYDTLERVPGNYVSRRYRQRADDVVWRLRIGGDWLYLYLLIEFQSSVDRYMAVRIMTYVGLLYEDLIRRGELLADGRLPPVLPIVLYNGRPRWSAPTEVGELIPPVPGLVAHFKPSYRYLLIDEGRYSETELAALNNLVAAVFRLEQAPTPEGMQQLIARLKDWLGEREDLRRSFAVWIRAALMRREDYHIVLPEIDDLETLTMGLSDRLEEWATEYKAEGRQEGRQEG
ncbi:Rpn family recombination-promoting nuclease/putative transposase, partial [Thiohalocapsa marina]